THHLVSGRTVRQYEHLRAVERVRGSEVRRYQGDAGRAGRRRAARRLPWGFSLLFLKSNSTTPVRHPAACNGGASSLARRPVFGAGAAIHRSATAAPIGANAAPPETGPGAPQL